MSFSVSARLRRPHRPRGGRCGSSSRSGTATPRPWDEILAPGVPFSSLARLPAGCGDFRVHIGDMSCREMESDYITTITVAARRVEGVAALQYAEGVPLYEDWECFGRLARAGTAAYLDVETAADPRPRRLAPTRTPRPCSSARRPGSCSSEGLGPGRGIPREPRGGVPGQARGPVPTPRPPVARPQAGPARPARLYERPAPARSSTGCWRGMPWLPRSQAVRPPPPAPARRTRSLAVRQAALEPDEGRSLRTGRTKPTTGRCSCSRTGGPPGCDARHG